MKKIINKILVGLGILLFLILATLLYLSPQKTTPFLDQKGQVLPNSITEIKTVPINGYPQRLLIRGKDKNNPILLHVHGGPGAPDQPFFGDKNLEDIFTVCYWEQKGAGASFSENIPVAAMQLHHLVEEGISVAKFLTDYLGQEKVYLQGHSWGTNIGINMAQRRPDLFRAYIGIGQMADSKRSEQLSYDFSLAEAEKAGDKENVKLLKIIGRPPYPTDADWLKKVMTERGVVRKYESQHIPNHQPKNMLQIYLAFITYPEYSINDKLNALKGDAFSMQHLWKEAIKVNLFEQVPRLDLPVYIIQGKYDKHTVTEVAKAYFNVLQAPSKKYFELENSAHNPHLEEFGLYKEIMQNEVLKNKKYENLIIRR